MNTKTVLWMLGLICMPFVITAQNSEQNESTFNRYMSRMQPMISQPTGDLMLETAKFFLGTPYVASTLEKEPEQLVVNLQELDCMFPEERLTGNMRLTYCIKKLRRFTSECPLIYTSASYFETTVWYLAACPATRCIIESPCREETVSIFFINKGFL